MCTVTIVPHDNGFRLTCSRDEQRTRPGALPPDVYRAGARSAVFPLDPVGGGTWVGVNDAGLAVTLLNRQRTTSLPTTSLLFSAQRLSRGSVVRRLLAECSVPSALQALDTLDVARFDPFRIVIVRDQHVAVATSDGCVLSSRRFFLWKPLLFASSSLGDDAVEHRRRVLFERMLARGRERPLEAQQRFHRHRWPARPEISVRMARADAHTVSVTTIDMGRHEAALSYEPLTDDPVVHGAWTADLAMRRACENRLTGAAIARERGSASHHRACDDSAHPGSAPPREAQRLLPALRGGVPAAAGRAHV